MNLWVLHSADKKTSGGKWSSSTFIKQIHKEIFSSCRQTTAGRGGTQADSNADAETMYTKLVSTLTPCLWFFSFTEYRVRWVVATWSWTAAANRVQQRAPLHLLGAWALPASPPPQLTTWLLTPVSATYSSICSRHDKNFILSIAIPGCWFDPKTNLYKSLGEVHGQRKCYCFTMKMYFVQAEIEQQH